MAFDVEELALTVGKTIAWLINILQNLIKILLDETIFKAQPELSTQFSGAISTLVLLTAVYLILALASSLRKVIGYIILIGWALLIIAIALTVMG